MSISLEKRPILFPVDINLAILSLEERIGLLTFPEILSQGENECVNFSRTIISGGRVDILTFPEILSLDTVGLFKFPEIYLWR